MAIIKILGRHSPSYSSLINYILKDGENKRSEIFTQNLLSDSIDGWTKEFILNESYRKNTRFDQLYLYHEILSFNSEDKDKLSTEIINDIAREYMKLRGNESVILGGLHKDKEHIHLHFCVSALKFRIGKSNRLSKAELLKLKNEIQLFHKQKYPEISKSSPNHGSGKSYQTNKQWYKEQRNQLKEQIENKVRSYFEKSSSRNEFLELLRDENLYYYERKGIPTGIEYENMKFRFSRLGIEHEQLESLPKDLSEEEKTLKEIFSIRRSREELVNDRTK